jgi:hypothetical protein
MRVSHPLGWQLTGGCRVLGAGRLGWETCARVGLPADAEPVGEPGGIHVSLDRLRTPLRRIRLGSLRPAVRAWWPV